MLEVAGMVTNHLISSGTIAEEERHVYFYGVETILSAGGFVALTLSLGWMLGMLPEVFVYLLASMPIRSFTGGYHAPTPEACIAMSLISAIIAIGLGFQNTLIALVPLLTILSLLLVIWLAPVVHPNHPYSEVRRNSLKKQARYVGLLESVLILMLCFVAPNYAVTASVAFLMVSLGILLAIACKQTVKAM